MLSNRWGPAVSTEAAKWALTVAPALAEWDAALRCLERCEQLRGEQLRRAAENFVQQSLKEREFEAVLRLVERGKGFGWTVNEEGIQAAVAVSP